MLIADDLDKLLKILPDFVRHQLEIHVKRNQLIEVVMDLGRQPEARFPDGPQYLSNLLISWNDLDFCIKRLGHFSGDNRSGIEYTLHRISSIKNRNGNIVGLTCRVGRAVFGTISIIRDLLQSDQSLLLLGKPGVGKTTAIREIARILADELEKRVVIIDTSNEIAGDGDIPHPAIGRARRMQVTRPELQHQVMIEAVENHMPEVIIIDEIGTELETLAARTIAERGVRLVGTAHGNYLENVIKNPILVDLVGGIQYVTLGDDEAKRRGSQKSILERKALPAFQVAIEMHKRDNWVIHETVDYAVDQILQGNSLYIQRRILNYNGSISIICENFNSMNFIVHGTQNQSLLNLRFKKKKSSIFNKHLYVDNDTKTSDVKSNELNKNIIRLYSYCINLQKISKIINSLNFAIIITRDIMKADVILGLRHHIKDNNKICLIAQNKQIIIYTIHSNTVNNIVRALKQILSLNKVFYLSWKKLCMNQDYNQLNVLFETRLAIEKIVLIKKQSVELLPQVSRLRKLQYKLIKLYNLRYNTFGKEPLQSLRIYPSLT